MSIRSYRLGIESTRSHPTGDCFVVHIDLRGPKPQEVAGAGPLVGGSSDQSVMRPTMFHVKQPGLPGSCWAGLASAYAGLGAVRGLYM